MADTLKINTTQNVRLNFEIASLGDRILATIIDTAVMYGYFFVLMLILRYAVGSTAVFLIMVLPVIFYHLLFEVFNNGRSIGKMAMKTRVIRMDGTEPRLGDYALRWLIGLFEGGLIAFFAYLIGGKGQRLGDMAAGTTVAKMKQRVTLEDTIYENTSDDYMPTYPEVADLADGDIEVIKEVLSALKKNYSPESIILAEKTKVSIETRLGVKSMEANTVAFLEKIIKDYSHITGRMD